MVITMLCTNEGRQEDSYKHITCKGYQMLLFVACFKALGGLAAYK